MRDVYEAMSSDELRAITVALAIAILALGVEAEILGDDSVLRTTIDTCRERRVWIGDILEGRK